MTNASRKQGWAIGTIRWFVAHLKLVLLLRVWPFVSYSHRNNRLEIEGQNRWTPLYPTEQDRASIYSELGLGVWKGRPSVFRLVKYPWEEYRHWEVHTLSQYDLPHLPKSVTWQLYQLSCLMLTIQQLDLHEHDLRNLDGILLETDCLHAIQLKHQPPTPEVSCDFAACPISKELLRLLGVCLSNSFGAQERI
jgi:hypothetical protein